MPKYRVELEAIEYEEVEAASKEEAEDTALEEIYGYRPQWSVLNVKEIEQ